MPELPEVETVRRTLQQFVLEKRIEAIDVYYPRIIEGDVNEFVNGLVGQTIHDIDRYGKYLVFILDDDAFVSHLRMEGKYHIVEPGTPITKHTHVVFHLNDCDLWYMDTRKFGRMQLVSHDLYRQQKPLNQLGKEPFDITDEELYARLHHMSLPIKSALLDQSLMCGIGNIYANEICFAMKIDPRTRSSRLSKQRVHELRLTAISILNHAIQMGGTTIHSFDSNGIHGLFQIELKVHGQKECPVCHGPLKKIMVNQRGTYFCPHCQKRRY